MKFAGLEHDNEAGFQGYSLVHGPALPLVDWHAGITLDKWYWQLLLLHTLVIHLIRKPLQHSYPLISDQIQLSVP